jgi:hypothetical protein
VLRRGPGGLQCGAAPPPGPVRNRRPRLPQALSLVRGDPKGSQKAVQTGVADLDESSYVRAMTSDREDKLIREVSAGDWDGFIVFIILLVVVAALVH